MEAFSWFQILVPKTGQNLEPRCESGSQVYQAPCARYSQLHELLRRSLCIRLLWLASPGQPTCAPPAARSSGTVRWPPLKRTRAPPGGR